jgi:Rrf2 family nitric oxide-sensitive transcriptional repressor
MRLTTFTDYSLRMLIYIAAAGGERPTIAAVARAYGVSERHMVKVAHVLGRAGWLKNTRGRGGGIALALPPSEINIGRVIRLTEGGDMLAECFDRTHNECRIAGSCRLQKILRDAMEQFYRELECYSLEDLTANRAQLRTLLHLRRPVQKPLLH